MSKSGNDRGRTSSSDKNTKDTSSQPKKKGKDIFKVEKNFFTISNVLQASLILELQGQKLVFV